MKKTVVFISIVVISTMMTGCFLLGEQSARITIDADEFKIKAEEAGYFVYDGIDRITGEMVIVDCLIAAKGVAPVEYEIVFMVAPTIGEAMYAYQSKI